MPLETLPDRFDNATHHELDRQVEEAIQDDLGGVSDLRHPVEYCFLLDAIIGHSNGHLDTKYLDWKHARELIKTHGELRDMLGSAWKRKSYRDIRNLALLKAPKPIEETIVPLDLSGAFQATYHGAAIHGFYEYLTHNEKLFTNGVAPQYYAKFCSIVQSSGTGKSRMLTELRKKGVIVIYMNLREAQDVVGFPARDPIPAYILTNFPSTMEAYQTTCYAFLTALFDTLEEYLSKNYTTPNDKEGIMRWVDQMCNTRNVPKSIARTDFFDKLADKYVKTRARLVRSLHEEPHNEATEVDKSTEKFKTLSLSAARKPHPLVPSHFSTVLSAAYKKVGACLARIFPDAPYQPKLVIALDEAHPLCKSFYAYRPADVLCRAVSDYSYAENHAVWVAFASTTPKVADFLLPPNQKGISARVARDGEQLFPPYTQLGWDQSAFRLREISMEDISRLDHILGYGRPLWLSLKTAFGQTRNVLDTASSKLYGPGFFNPYNTDHVLAMFGQRFGLNITLGHSDSVEHLEKGVASHLRILLATTLNRDWMFTCYPSEPLLSCVAARDLHAAPTLLEKALGTLLRAISIGVIDMGQRGELASRLLWLLAKDLFIRTKAKNVVTRMPGTWDGHLPDCQMIPVVDWLEYIFGDQIWGEAPETSVARKTFENAYLNFSHWICMEANIAGSKEGNELPLDEWTLRLWQRTSAVQCCQQQPLVDKVIPIYFKSEPTTASAEPRMSQIFISDETRGSKNSKDALQDITRTSEYLSGNGGKHDPDSLPYIAILADLGQPASFSVTFPEPDVDDRCLRVYAAGVNATTYPFLTDYPALMDALRNLVQLQNIPERERPYTEFLNGQVEYGSTATPEHMLWEHGKDVPNVRGKSPRRT